MPYHAASHRANACPTPIPLSGLARSAVVPRNGALFTGRVHAEGHRAPSIWRVSVLADSEDTPIGCP